MSGEFRVLVVDDMADVADTLAGQLSLDGYNVSSAYSTNEAILRIEAERPHCVLLDVGMPDMDGFELASLLRHRYKDEIILIAVTGSDPLTARVADTFSVVDHYFQKPLDPAALHTILPPLGHKPDGPPLL